MSPRACSAALTFVLAAAALAAAQCPNPCAGLSGQSLTLCCRQGNNSQTPACGGPPCSSTCYNQYSSIAETNPQEYGLDMQECCSQTAHASESQNGGSCTGYVVGDDTALCDDNCAPPMMAQFNPSDQLVLHGGWGSGASVNVYVDPSIDAMTMTNGKSPAGAVQAIQTEIRQAASQLGFSVTFSPSPLPPATGYSVLRGGATGDKCTPSLPACTYIAWSSSGNTAFAQTWVELQSSAWNNAQENLMPEIEWVARHEFLHSDAVEDDYVASCQGQSSIYFQMPVENSVLPPPTMMPNRDLCSATLGQKGMATGGTSGGGYTPSPGCSGAQPNYTCTCDATTGTWDCECDNPQTICSDGDPAVCSNGFWACGSSTTQIIYPPCPGQEPLCGQGVAACTQQGWTCDGGPCNGAIAPVCEGQPECDQAHGELYCYVGN